MCSVGSASYGQLIDVGSLDPGPYGPGSNITVPIKVKSSFVKGTKFELYLSDATGTFNPLAPPIGTFDSHFATFVNGVIPGGTPAGSNYKLRVKIVSPSTENYISVSGPIVISGTAGPTVKVDPTEAPRVLVADRIWGYCTLIKDGNVLTIKNASTTGAAVTGVLYNDYDPAVSPVNFDFNSTAFYQLNLNTAYYTVRFRAIKNGVVSTKSYVVLNSTYNLSLQSSGTQTACIPAVNNSANSYGESELIRYSVNVGTPSADNKGSILSNYPGLVYRFDWGDSNTDYITQGQLLDSAGNVKHRYSETSCGRAPIMLQTPIYNSYQANIFIEAPFCAGASVPITTYPKVYKSPVANFEIPGERGCVNRPVLINNTTIPGRAEDASGMSCTDETFYLWYVKKNTEPETAWVPYSDEQNFIHVFTQPGTYNVKLVASNNSCTPSEKVLDVCIEESPKLDYEITQSAQCIPADIVVTNKTAIDKVCKISWAWSVLNAETKSLVNDGVTFITPSTDYSPKIRITKAGDYILRLTSINACDTLTLDTPFTVAGPLSVSLPENWQVCRKLPVPIDFSADERHKPVYTGFGKSKTYNWTVSGGAFSYEKGSSGSPYPTIRFESPGTYTVTVFYNNECNAQVSDSQVITFYGPIVKDAGPDAIVCDNVPTGSLKSNTTFKLHGNQPQPYENGLWSIVGSSPSGASFDDPTKPEANILNLVPGTYQLRWTISNPAGCAEYDEMQLTVYAKPEGGAISGPTAVCYDNGTTLKLNNYKGKIVGWETSPDNVVWTAVAGSEGKDSFLFEHLQQKTFVRVSVASSGSDSGCGSKAYSSIFTMNVDPVSVGGTTSGDATFCEGTAVSGDVTLSGQTGTIVRWERLAGGSTWVAIASVSNPYHYSGLTGSTKFRAVVQSGTCDVAYSSPTTITIEKKPTAADAGDDEFICATSTSFQLHGNIPAIGNGIWTQSFGPPAVIEEPSKYNTIVSGLQKGNRYKFTWTISNGSCVPSASTMSLDVLSDIINSVKADHAVSCKGDLVALRTDVLSGGNVSGYPANYSFVWEASADGITNWAVLAGADKETVTVNPFATTYFRRRVKSFGECEVVSAPVQIIVNAGTPNADAGPDVILCNLTNYTLSGNDPGTGFSGTWTDDAAGSLITFFPDAHAPNAEVRGLEAGKTYNLRWTIAGISPCPDRSDVVKIVVRKPVTAASAGADQSICLNKQGSNTSFTLDGNEPQASNGETGTWTKVSGPAVTIDHPSMFNSTVSGLQPGDYVFQWQTKNDATVAVPGCSGSTAQVNIRIVAYPVAGTIQGAISRLCQGSDPGVLKVNGYTSSAFLQWQASSDNITFTDLPGANSETLSPGALSATTWYRVVVRQAAPCLASELTMPFQIIVDEPTIAGKAVSSISRVCTGVNSVTVKAIDFRGDVVRWQSSADNATWFTVPGTGTSNTFTNLASSIYYRAIVRNGSCNEEPSSSVFIEVLPNVTAADAGRDQFLCNEGSFRLEGNTPVAGSGSWTQVSGPAATIDDSSNPTTTISSATSGTYVFRWSISNNICDASTDDVVIHNYPPLTNAITGSTTICSGQTVDITGAEPGGGNGSYNYKWVSSHSATGPWIIVNGATTATYSATLTSTSYFKRIVDAGPCSMESNIVEVSVQPPISNNLISADQELCLGQPPAKLSGSQPLGGDGNYQYQWEQSLDGVLWTNIPGETSADYQPAVLAQSVQIRRVVTTSLCAGDQKSISNIVTITIRPLAKAEFKASKQKACSPFNLKDVITLVPYDDRNSTYEWFVDGVSIGASRSFPDFVISEDGKQVTVKLVAESRFGCGANSTELVFQTVKHVKASFTKDKEKGCGPLAVSFTNTSAPLQGADYHWDFGDGQTSSLEQPGTIIFKPHPLNRDTTYIVRLTASTDCQSTEYVDSVLVRPLPLVSFTPDKTRGCSPLEITIANESRGIPNKYIFDFGDGNTLEKNDNFDVKHTYYTTKTDTVTLKLTAINECGVDTKSYQIVIYPNTVTPKLVVDGNRKYGCVPFAVKFDNNSTGANRFYWDFNDGGTLVTTQSPESVFHTFTTPGTYQVNLTATNGCSTGSTSETIVVYPKPNSEFTAGRSLNCVKDSIQFVNEKNAASSFTWDFGDGTYSNLPNPKHAYLHSGKYDVKLTAVQSYPDGSVCSNTATHAIQISALPVASFISNSSYLNCVPYKLVVASTPANAAGVQWDFGDPASADNIGTGYTSEHIYTEPGLYKIRLTAYNEAGCIDTSSQYVRISARPKPAFEASKWAACGSTATVLFTNKTTYAGTDAVSYKWLINNNVVGKTKDLTFTFNAAYNASMPDKFEVKLIATSAMGCPDTVVHYFQLNPLPSAAFTTSESAGCPPLRLNIQNTSKYADQYWWYLDNELISTDREPTGIILSQADKIYKLKLVVKNKYDCGESSTEKQFSTYPKPTALFKVQDSVSCNGMLDIKITNASTGASRYLWDFGDGSSRSTEATPAHIYGQPGVYKLKLIAYNSLCSDTAIVNVRIAQVPQAAFKSDVTKGCTQVRVTFQNLSVNATSYLWDFGDGTFSTSPNPQHTFSYINSPYNVKLTAYGEFGCSNEVVQTNYIQVIEPPQADFTISPDSVVKIPNYTFSFKNQSKGAVVKYIWSFGDGQSTQDENPTHTYKDAGEHVVRLVVVNAEGCQDTMTRKVRIDGVPGYLYVPNSFEPGNFKTELKTFRPKGSGIAKYSLKIFDTWGRMVWQSDKLDEKGSPSEGWDGTSSGQPAPQGVYVWRIDAVFIDGTEWKGMKYETGARSAVGPIHLIR
ncbi:PKD domain-containing protein [Arcticibacter sp. MXS-1]|uniref:PKD domain-containing protein n=1 Tax=Arcticibacter sp. MXS-1 TaxID=3341726 RepID=UPI0035A85266